MSGRKRNPCEFCGDELCGTDTAYVEHRNGYCLWAEFYPFKNRIVVTAQANDEMGEMIEDSIELPMNYCPNCGRKLTDD